MQSKRAEVAGVFDWRMGGGYNAGVMKTRWFIGCVVAVLMAPGCDSSESSSPPASAPSPPAGGAAQREWVAISQPSTGPETGTEGVTAREEAAEGKDKNGARASSPPMVSEGPPPYTPLRDAKAGEVAAYRDLAGQTVRYRIASVGDLTVKTEIAVFDAAGRPVGHAVTREDRRDLDPLRRQASRMPTGRTAMATTVEVGGRRYDATLYEERWSDEGVAYVRRSWVSPEVPVFGLLRMELVGDTTVEARLEYVAGK